MHVVTLAKPVHTGPDFGTLDAGEWLLHDQNAFELAMIAERGVATLRHYEPSTRGADLMWGGGKTLIVRSGAWGDLVLLSPVLAELPGVINATLSCGNQHHPMFAGSRSPLMLADYPIRLCEAEEYQAIVDLGNVIETNRHLHCTDAFSRALGMENVRDYRPRYTVTEDERKWALAKYPRTDSKRRRLGIQMGTSHPAKMYPLPSWLRVISILEERGWEIMLLGTKNEFPPLKPTYRHVYCCYTEGYTFRESAAILSTCDAFAGVDSVFLHMCHALDIPAIGLYGPFPWELYTSKAPKTRALTGQGECSPCFHSRRGPWFPRDQPCHKLNHCTVLSSIKAEHVAAKVDALIP